VSRRIFISYRRDGARYQARQIYSALCRVLPADQVFMDTDSIPPGADFRAILKGWVDQCDVMLALITPDWADAVDPKTGKRRLDNANDFVRIELAAGLVRDIPVVPILLDQAELPERDGLPPDLQNLVDRQAQFIEFRTFDHDVERLLSKLGLRAGGEAAAALSSDREQHSSPGSTADKAAHEALAETTNHAASWVADVTQRTDRDRSSSQMPAEAIRKAPAASPPRFGLNLIGRLALLSIAALLSGVMMQAILEGVFRIDIHNDAILLWTFVAAAAGFFAFRRKLMG
jgi:hypothetical protein